MGRRNLEDIRLQRHQAVIRITGAIWSTDETESSVVFDEIRAGSKVTQLGLTLLELSGKLLLVRHNGFNIVLGGQHLIEWTPDTPTCMLLMDGDSEVYGMVA